jgi:hypothetical protein
MVKIVGIVAVVVAGGAYALWRATLRWAGEDHQEKIRAGKIQT